MQATWSLIINVLLLFVVVMTMARMMRAKRRNERVVQREPSLGDLSRAPVDDVIAVRKISPEEPVVNRQEPEQAKINVQESPKANSAAPTLMLFLSAKEGCSLAGYELLQVVLAAGLRFGEGHLFHRHQFPNGQGPVLCSLAAATASGMFDLQNISEFSVRGVCLFMYASGNAVIDEERFKLMLDTAERLKTGLDTLLLDDEQQPWSEASLARYQHTLALSAAA